MDHSIVMALFKKLQELLQNDEPIPVTNANVSSNIVPRPLEPMPQMAPQQQSPAPTLSPRQTAEQELSRLQDPNRYKVPKAEGGSRDEDHNWWDSAKTGLLGAGIGFIKGGLGGAIGGGATGAIMGGLDRNADEKLIDRQWKIPQAQQRVESEREREQFDTEQAYKDAQAKNALIRPQIAQADLERKIVNDERNYQHKVDTLNWRKEDREEYLRLEQVKQEAKTRNDDRTYELAVRKQTEIERNNVASEEGKTKRTEMIVTGQKERQASQQDFTARQNALKMQMQAAVKQYEEASKNQRQAEAHAAKLKLQQLKAEYDGLQ